MGRIPARNSSVKMPSSASRKGKLPNGNILSFFKKVDGPEESMFVGSGVDPLPPVAAIEDDVYGDEDDISNAGDQDRYNESQASVKRRKVSDTAEQPERSEQHKDDPNSRIEPTRAVQPVQRKNVPRGPFVDDSDSDDDAQPAHLFQESLEESQKRGEEFFPPPLKQTSMNESPILTSPSKDTEGQPALKFQESTNGDFVEFADIEQFDEDDFEGEESRLMKYMEEQARLEAQAEDVGSYSCDDGVGPLPGDDAMEQCCPICNISLAGVSPDEATVHVNACLDGQPVPLPRPKPANTPPGPSPVEGESSGTTAQEMSKRFARAAMPRPGQANPISVGGAVGGNSEHSNSAFAKLMSGHAEDAAWATAAAAEYASRGKPAYQRTCPFYKIMPGFFICVDAFRYGAVEGCNAYFLSHFHSDHYVGLTASWTHGPIYCSKVTGSLVKSQLRTAAKYVVELDFEDTVPIPGTEGVSVTMIPANHCPGSSMFLFEKVIGNRGPKARNGTGPLVHRILHCGDFRACPAQMAHPQLKPETVDAITGKTKQQKIDVCYLDTTYLNPRYSFPSQDDVIRSCADLCASLNKGLMEDDETEWDKLLRRREGSGAAGNDTLSRFLKNEDKNHSNGNSSKSQLPSPDPGISDGPADAFTAMKQKQQAKRNRLLVVCGTYSIGKERICKAVAQALGTKIFASASKIRICEQLGDPELSALMTSDPREAQVHMQMLMELRAETLAEYLDNYRPHFGRVVGFRPSGWNYRPSLANGNGSAAEGGDRARVAAAAVSPNMPPSSLPTAQLLHGAGWRTRFTACDLVPQRGSTREAACFGVPYSEHSSFRELALFLMGLRIERIVPTVNVGSGSSRRRMKGWTDRWLSERRRGGVVTVLLEGEDDESAGGETGREKAAGLWDGKDGGGGGAYW